MLDFTNLEGRAWPKAAMNSVPKSRVARLSGTTALKKFGYGIAVVQGNIMVACDLRQLLPILHTGTQGTMLRAIDVAFIERLFRAGRKWARLSRILCLAWR